MASASVHWSSLPPHPSSHTCSNEDSSPPSATGSHAPTHGVLLYYCIAPVDDVQATCNRLRRHSLQVNLVGRIRVSPQGLNVTVAGPWGGLQAHVEEVCKDPKCRGADFKAAECPWPPPPILARECGLSCLTVRAVQELVTLGGGRQADLACAGSHVSPSEFHSLILSASSAEDPSAPPSSEVGQHSETSQAPVSSVRKPPPVVVLDARNIYETRVGRFEPPPGVPLLNPGIRQFSDLPGWIDQHEEELRGKTILMYCTGGVRCEGASAYIRAKGPDFSRTHQLSGGIVRYLEAFPSGGLFRGKNFVFDHRLVVPPADGAEVVGECLRCRAACDDYSSRSRCPQCRMLVLLCEGCQGEGTTCELCHKASASASAEQEPVDH